MMRMTLNIILVTNTHKHISYNIIYTSYGNLTDTCYYTVYKLCIIVAFTNYTSYREIQVDVLII